MYVCVFRANHLACSYLGKTISPTQHAQLPVFLCRSEASGFPQSTLACLLISSRFSSHLVNHIAETLWIQLLTLLGDTPLEQTPWSFASSGLPVASSQCSLSLGLVVFVDVSVKTGCHNSAPLLLWEVTLMRGEVYTYSTIRAIFHIFYIFHLKNTWYMFVFFLLWKRTWVAWH